MEPDSRYTVIGAIVLALALAMAAGFVWLSSSGAASDFRFYAIRFEQQSLEGLQVGGDVNMRGVKVGRVEHYTIDAGNINRVEVLIRVASKTPVRENTVAVVARNFVTGIARINLVTPGTPGPELTRVADGNDHPVIPEGTSGFDQITESATRLAVAGERALGNVNELLTPANQKAFGETLANLRDLSAGLNQRLVSLDVAARGIQESAAALKTSGERIGSAVERGAAQIEPLARQTGELLRESTTTVTEARAAIRDGRAVLGDTQTAVRDFANAARALEAQAATIGRRADEALDGSVLELRATAQEVRRTAELLSVALDRMADPRAALLGPGEAQLGPGERKR